MSVAFGPPKKTKVSGPKRTCLICCEDKNDFLNCPTCSKSACSDCYRLFFDSSTEIIPPRCMHRVDAVECPHEFDESELSAAFTSDYIKTLTRERRMARLLTHDKFFERDTMEVVLPLVQIGLEQLTLLKEAQMTLRNDANGHEAQRAHTLLRDFCDDGSCLKTLKKALTWRMPDLLRDHQSEAPAKGYRQYAKCSAAPTCKGMFDMDVGNCFVCSRKHCRECFSTRVPGGKHTCSPDDLGNASWLRDNTKPCPRCKHPIEKGPMCSQMMCTLCHCVYDWNTLKLETGLMHNPYYFSLTPQEREAVRERQTPITHTFGDSIRIAINWSEEREVAEPTSTRITRMLNEALSYAFRLLKVIEQELQYLEDDDREFCERLDRVQSILRQVVPPYNLKLYHCNLLKPLPDVRVPFDEKRREINMLTRDKKFSHKSRIMRDRANFAYFMRDTTPKLASAITQEDNHAICELLTLMCQTWMKFRKEDMSSSLVLQNSVRENLGADHVSLEKIEMERQALSRLSEQMMRDV